jgi:hypothetical protein
LINKIAFWEHFFALKSTLPNTERATIIFFYFVLTWNIYFSFFHIKIIFVFIAKDFCFYFILLLLFLVGLGFELGALSWQNRVSISSAPPPIHFTLVIWEMGGLMNYLPRLASHHDPLDPHPLKWLGLQV